MNVRWIIQVLTVSVAVNTAVNGGQCRKTRLAIECYWNCANSSKVTNASTCACGNLNETRLQQHLHIQLRAFLSNEVPQATTVYRNARKISIALEPNQHAFVYIFEFSPVTSATKWSYAGSSPSPTIEFEIPDPCMDYQFRVFAILQSTNSNNGAQQLIAYRARAISVDLPPFSLTSEQIRMEQIIYNKDNRTIDVYINWKNPRGYTQADIFGYESPAVYPIQCLSPEDLLPTPIVETFAKGGRLRLTLPIEMLEEKCRLWFEVRMLPTCLRIEPFTVQQTVELNCDNLQTIDICRQSVPPQCTEVVDIWGSDNEVVFMWQPPPNIHKPLYYSVRYGPVELQGTDPFLSWMIIMETDLKVDGDTNTIKIPIRANVNYGAQICAVYSEENSNIKFGLVKVIPFMCSSCSPNRNPAAQTSGSCGECSKIENSQSLLHRCLQNSTNKSCATVINLSSSQQRTLSNQKFEESDDVPLTDEVFANAVNDNDNSTIANDRNANADTTIYKETANRTKPLSINIEKTIDSVLTAELKQANVNNLEAIINGNDKELLSQLTRLAENATDIDGKYADTLLYNLQPYLPDVSNKSDKHLVPAVVNSSTLTQKAVPLIKNQTDGLPVLNQQKNNGQHIVGSTVTAISATLRSAEAEKTFDSTATKSREIRMHQKSLTSFKGGNCMLTNGVLCQFGCETIKKCICPEPKYSVTLYGECQLNEQFNSSFHCIYTDDINATWDSQLMLLKINSNKLYAQIKENNFMDRVYLEFGKIMSNALEVNDRLKKVKNDVFFADDKRYKVVLETEKIKQQEFFTKKPFPFYLNHDIQPAAYSYGLRICEYNSAKVTMPYSVDWDVFLTTKDSNKPYSTQIQISPVNFFSAEAALMLTTNMTHLFLTIPLLLIVVLLLLVFIIIFFDCTKLQHLCGRRKTKYYQTYIVNSRNPCKNRNKLSTHNGFMISTARY